MHYVIGDVHGQLDALRLLLEKIKYNPAADYRTFSKKAHCVSCGMNCAA